MTLIPGGLSSGPKMTLDSQAKLLCCSFQPVVGGAPGGWQFYDPVVTDLRLSNIKAWGFNCVKRNGSGLNSTTNQYPDDVTFQGILSDWYARLRKYGLVTYLNNSYSSTVFQFGRRQANINRMIQVLGWHMQYGADLIVGYDLCNEINSYANGAPSWQAATLNEMDQQVAVSDTVMGDMQSLLGQMKQAFPQIPYAASIYVTTGSSWTGDMQPWFKFQRDLGLDFHDYHPYQGTDTDGQSVANAPDPANVVALEQAPWFIGRHFAGEFGTKLGNTDAVFTAFTQALGGHAARPLSHGANHFCDVNFAGGNFGSTNVTAKLQALSSWPKGIL